MLFVFLFTIQVPALAKYVHIIVLTPRDLSVSYQNVSVNIYQQITALITNKNRLSYLTRYSYQTRKQTFLRLLPVSKLYDSERFYGEVP